MTNKSLNVVCLHRLHVLLLEGHLGRCHDSLRTLYSAWQSCFACVIVIH